MNTERDERVSTATIAREITQRYYPDDDELADAIKRTLDTERNQRDKSLLSSEVARAIALHIKGKNSDYFYTSEGLAELEAIVSRHFVVAAQSDAATRMGDRCVAKVKAALADEQRKWPNGVATTDYELGQRAAFTYAISALQSLTLDQVEQEKR